MPYFGTIYIYHFRVLVLKTISFIRDKNNKKETLGKEFSQIKKNEPFHSF